MFFYTQNLPPSMCCANMCFKWYLHYVAYMEDAFHCRSPRAVGKVLNKYAIISIKWYSCTRHTNINGIASKGGSWHKNKACVQTFQSSGGVWKSRCPSWAPVPNTPTVSVDVKQHFNITKHFHLPALQDSSVNTSAPELRCSSVVVSIAACWFTLIMTIIKLFSATPCEKINTLTALYSITNTQKQS